MLLESKKITVLNTLLNILFFLVLVRIFEEKIGIFKVLKISLILSSYYVFNIFNLEKGKYEFEDFINSAIINIPLFLASLRLYVFDGGAKFFILVFVFQNISKLLFYLSYKKKEGILIVGENSKINELIEIINKKDVFKLSAYIKIENINEIESLLLENDITKIILAEEVVDKETIKIMLKQKLNGVEFYDYISFYEELEEKVPINLIDEKWILLGDGYSLLRNGFNVRIKRIMDIILVLLVGIAAFPVMVISALIVKMESKGSAIYKQTRVGLGNKEFEIYKFRSMVIDAEKNGAQWAIEDDPRVTKFGNFMRKTRIDELPQLWNVLRGDMTFVGSRPERPDFIEELIKEIPFYNIRHCVKPGLTGWAQVKYAYGSSIEDAFQKLQYDLYYIKHQSLAFDLMILFKTVRIVLFRKGR